ncbi:MAG: C10 family peptidase [Tidjanibacter sp.]|nr:C10 family peptidase [Tidjanibacter sp.]
MKRKLCFLFVLPLLFAACENVLPIEEVDLSSMVAEFTTPTKTVTFEGHVVDMDYLVTSADLETYLELQPNSPNGIKRAVKSVEAKGPNADVTLMYVVNYDKGWEILSADKRAQPVLAFSDGGEFSFETANPGEKVWLEGLACDVLNLRTADKALQSRAAENNPNVGFWRGLELRKKMMEEELEMMTRIELPDSITLPPLTPLPDMPDYPEHGHWELTGTTTESVPVDTVNHMTQTRWYQKYPWNYYCPLENGQRTIAGCVAIAAAQMLYYLHNKIGHPQSALLEPSFYEEYPNYNDSTIWNVMGHRWIGTIGVEELSAARLIRDVGAKAEVEYGISNSGGAYTSDMPVKVFQPYGISCAFADYAVSTVKSSLRQGMPVYMTAYSEPLSGGHAFIIDGYIRYKTVTTYEYSWFYDEEFAANNPIDKVLPRYEYRDGPADIQYICMNWGWYDDIDNYTWYGMWSDWSTTTGTYRYLKEMLTGFDNM